MTSIMSIMSPTMYIVAAVVWRDGKRTSAVPQEHLDAVVGYDSYELHERGIYLRGAAEGSTCRRS